MMSIYPSIQNTQSTERDLKLSVLRRGIPRVLRTATLSAERERGDVGIRPAAGVASWRICTCTFPRCQRLLAGLEIHLARDLLSVRDSVK